jgi:hypothetical protein
VSRLILTFAIVLAAPAIIRAELLPTFSADHCMTAASHVVVVDNTGKVLESWRGDLKPGDLLPLAEFHLKLEREVSVLAREEGEPDRVTGKRLVLFLKKGGPKPYGGQVAGSWGPAHFSGQLDVSMLWIEDRQAFALEQPCNPGPQMILPEGREATFKKHVKQANEVVANWFAKARATENLAERAKILVYIVSNFPGFAPEAFAGLEWCKGEALPALRTLLKPELSTGHQEILAAYLLMARMGESAHEDFLKECDLQLTQWKQHAGLLEKAGRLSPEEERMYQRLLAVTSNRWAFENLTAEQQKTLDGLRELFAKHPVLSKLGDKDDRIADRLDFFLQLAK